MNTPLTDLMHRATENLDPVTPDLLERTVQQGLRQRRRRTTALTVTGASAVLAGAALIAGGIQLFGSPSDAAVAGTPILVAKPTTTAKPTPTAKPGAPDAKQTLATLKSIVSGPGRTLSAPATWGSASKGYTAAAYTVNDGHGASRIEVLVSGPGRRIGCTDRPDCTAYPDGSSLVTQTERPEYPAPRNKDGVVSNYVTLQLASGESVSITNYNAAAEKGAQHTRQKPLFATSDLITMAHDRAWDFPRAAPYTPKSGKPTK